MTVYDEIKDEVERATAMHGPIYSLHEALGIIYEEFEEFKQDVFRCNLAKGRDTRPHAREELIQLAAMCVKTITCLNLPKE